MKKKPKLPWYFYQENGGEFEVIYEDASGMEWICDCGDIEHPQSERTAKLLVKLLNKNLKGE